MKSALITVGTTNFDELLKNIDQQWFYDLLNKNGFDKIIY